MAGNKRKTEEVTKPLKKRKLKLTLELEDSDDQNGPSSATLSDDIFSIPPQSTPRPPQPSLELPQDLSIHRRMLQSESWKRGCLRGTFSVISDTSCYNQASIVSLPHRSESLLPQDLYSPRERTLVQSHQMAAHDVGYSRPMHVDVSPSTSGLHNPGMHVDVSPSTSGLHNPGTTSSIDPSHSSFLTPERMFGTGFEKWYHGRLRRHDPGHHNLSPSDLQLRRHDPGHHNLSPSDLQLRRHDPGHHNLSPSDLQLRRHDPGHHNLSPSDLQLRRHDPGHHSLSPSNLLQPVQETLHPLDYSYHALERLLGRNSQALDRNSQTLPPLERHLHEWSPDDINSSNDSSRSRAQPYSPETSSPKDPTFFLLKKQKHWELMDRINRPSDTPAHCSPSSSNSTDYTLLLISDTVSSKDTACNAGERPVDRFGRNTSYKSPNYSNQSSSISLPPSPKASSCSSRRTPVDRFVQNTSYKSPSYSNQSLPPTPETASPKASSCSSRRTIDSRSTTPDSIGDHRNKSPDVDYSCNVEPLSEVDELDNQQSGSGKGKARKPTKYGRCKVCGRPASGNHYHVLSCEGCKGFWRRVIQREHEGNTKVYVCKGGDNNCPLDGEKNDNLCPSCRKTACEKAGMKRELVMDEPTREAHNAKKAFNRRRRAEEARIAPNAETCKTFTAHCKVLAEGVEAAFQKAKEVAGQSSEERRVTAEEFQRECDQHGDVFFHLRSDVLLCLAFMLWLHDHVVLTVKQDGELASFEETRVFVKMLFQLPYLVDLRVLYSYQAEDSSLCFGNKRLTLKEMEKLPPQMKVVYARFFEKSHRDSIWLSSCQQIMDESIMAILLARDYLRYTDKDALLDGQQNRGEEQTTEEARRRVEDIQDWCDALAVYIINHLRGAIKAKCRTAGQKCSLALLFCPAQPELTTLLSFGEDMRAVLPSCVEDIRQHRVALTQRADYVSLAVCTELDISRWESKVKEANDR